MLLEKKRCYVDKEMNDFIAELNSGFSYKLKKVVDTTPFTFTVYNSSSESKDSYKQLSGVGENNTCNLVADYTLTQDFFI